ncbi:MAG: excinuclease ABC subunit UvrC [Treponema sp.]|jgi:excinuclease ABC subunit C|nr:excinuclease ABC subunit UvrC [Treponema sp.]
MEILDTLKAIAHDAPLEPGVYLWKDEMGRIIYVGKAKILRHRLCSYFSGKKEPKTTALIKRAITIEIILTTSEYEALILESTLIKEHSPKYNIDLKDGKSYPVIRITEEKFPRVFKTRRIIEDGSKYFGPYPNVQAVDNLMGLIEKVFPLRKCRVMHKRESPCMYFHIGRCLAPCCGKTSIEHYQKMLEKVEKIVSGNTESFIIELTESMHRESASLNFEKAAELRNTIRSIEALTSITSSIIDISGETRDYIAIASEGVLTSIALFSLRSGKMIGRELFRTRSAANDDETLMTFIMSYYGESHPPPSKIFVKDVVNEQQEIKDGMDESGFNESGVEDAKNRDGFKTSVEANDEDTGDKTRDEDANPLGDYLKIWFLETFGRTPEILIPNERQHAAVIAMTQMNADEDLRKRVKERGAGPALDELQKELGLQRRPERIEGFDIAQLNGKHPVASLVTFKEGVPDKRNYRIFKLRTVIDIVDDFAAMREVVKRRYSRLQREKRNLPDLILVDGGLGQVNAAKAVLDDLGLDIDVVGLAKRDEELWLPSAKTPLKLSRRSEGLKALQFVRDETHRFATSFNQKLRSADLCFAVLENIDSIGSKTAAVVMKTYASLERIAEAATEDITAKCRITAEQARVVKAAVELALSDTTSAQERFSEGKKRSAPRVAPKKSRQAKTPKQTLAKTEVYDEESASVGVDLAAEAMKDYGD